MAGLKIKIEDNSEGTQTATLNGVIDESADLQPLLDGIKGDVTLDIGGVERINSMGVLRWTKAISELSDRRTVKLAACPYPMVFQANVVSNFFGAAEVISCVAPYFCAQCNAGVEMLVTTEEVRANGEGSPEKACPTCGGPTEFDELDDFFGFMR